MALNIVFIGSGNVAFHLSQGLQRAGFNIRQVYSRKLKNAKALARILNCGATHQLEKIEKEANLYIIAVHDDAIAGVASKLSGSIGNNKLVVHTSGSVASSVLKSHFKSYGVFYPLQSLSKNKTTDLTNVPFCIDSNKKPAREKLFKIANEISKKVYFINDQERAKLHVAAVLVNNFTNHLYHMAYKILQDEGLPFEALVPLIQETANKIVTSPPYDMQTGPGRRGDQAVIQKHLKYLEKHPRFQNIYELLTESILKTYKKK